MKVKIEVTVDVDVEAWALEYGIEEIEVRKDVKEYFQIGAIQMLESLDLHNKD